MSEYQQRIAIAGLRRINVTLQRGDVRVERVEGTEIIVEADVPIRVEQQGDELRIGAQGGLHGHRHRMEMRMGDDMEMRMGDELEMRLKGGLAGLGAQIGEAVSGAMDALFNAELSLGGFEADLRLGVPAALERPAISVSTGNGDLRIEDLTAEWMLKSGFGDVSVYRGGGTLALHTGKGDIQVDRFEGSARAVSGYGDLHVREVTGRVELRTGAGDVVVDDCTAGGSLQSGSGDIRATIAGSSWNLRSGSGDVEVRVHQIGSLNVATGHGDVQIGGDALGLLRLQTGSGDVTCKCLLVGSRHAIISGHGDIELALADPPGARLQIITGHGDISSEYPLVRVGKQGPRSAGSARYVGNVGDSTIDIEVRTSSGDVTISRLHPSESAQAAAAGARAAAGDAAGDAAGRNGEAGATAGDPAAHAGESSSDPPVPPIPPIPPIAPIPPMPPFRSPANAIDGSAAPGDSEPGQADSPTAAAESRPDIPATEDSRLGVLQSLQRGEISVEEASLLLEALGSRGS